MDVFEDGGDAFSLKNGYVEATFSKDGMMQGVETLDDKTKTKAQIQFIKYGTR